MSSTPGTRNRNIELKARCHDLRAAETICKSIGARDEGVLTQRDTYFRAAHGRLKLRQFGPDRAELIWYHRADQPAARRSDYQIVPVLDPSGLREALGMAVGILIEVKKIRKLLLWENVRIHLDEVEGLGNFVEFEAVLSPAEADPKGYSQLAQLRKLLSIKDQDLICESYSDLLLVRAAGTASP